MTYLVRWEIEIGGESPREAAENALAIQRDPNSTATVFDVTGQDDVTVTVDLSEDEDHDMASDGPPCDAATATGMYDRGDC